MISFTGTAQVAGAGGRSGAAGIPVRGSLMGRFSLCIIASFTFLLVHWLALWCCLGNQVSGGIAVVTNTGWYGQVGVFLEALSNLWAFGFTYVHGCVQGPGSMLSRI